MKATASHLTEKLNELVCQRDADLWRLDYEGLSPPDQVFLVIWELYSEVYNGGLLRFFSNHSGRLVPYVVEALRAIGAHQAVVIVEKAIFLVGPDVPWDDDVKRWSIRQGLQQQIRKHLFDLDGQFNAYIDGLPVLLFHYLSNHREQVDAPAEFWTEANIQ
jgi:hypothetical protein